MTAALAIVVLAAAPNIFGVGLTGPGETLPDGRNEIEVAAELVGPKGHLKLIFAGIERASDVPKWKLERWKRSVALAYAKELIPVIRLGPPWERHAVRE